jgi:rubrerythrin
MNLQECFLRLAQLEADAGKLYGKFSEQCSERLKPVVISFSKEEEKHKSYMLELSSNENLKEKQINEDLEAMFDDQVNYLNSDDEILDLNSEKDFFGFALKLEKNSVEIYTKLLGDFQTDSNEYKGFEALIKEERKHMLYILNKLYELK